MSRVYPIIEDRKRSGAFMSTDQRPRRAVMVDSGQEVADPQRGTAAGDGDKPLESDASVAPKPRVMLPTIFFLLACAAGGIGIALMPFGGL